MKINRLFNTLTAGELLYCIEHGHKYTDFNTLGLFRGILESTTLSPDEQLRLRDQAIATFQKPYAFLQLKDPVTYVALNTLGEELTEADRKQVWQDVRLNQQRLLASKKLRHRNFGVYSKHLCGYDNCHLQGLMIRQGSVLTDSSMWFCSDKGRGGGRQNKAQTRKQERKAMKKLVAAHSEDE